MEEHVHDAAVIVEAAQAAADPTELEIGKRYAFVAGGQVHKVDTVDQMPSPERKKGSVTVHTTEDLTRYVELHRAGDDAGFLTAVYVDQDAARITAVLNDHPADGSAWRDHLAVLPLKKTDAWLHWRSKDGKPMSQEEFAEHIEEGLPEIAVPDGADLFEIAQTFHAQSEVTFKQQHRLASGAVKLEWDESVDASAGKDGELEIPTEFILMVAPYVGEIEQQVTARLRFRIRERKLQLSYKLDRPDDVERTALDTIATTLRGRFEHVYLGQPV